MGHKVFGVSQSISRKKWIERPYEPRVALGLAQQFNLPALMGRLLSSRGIDAEGVNSFLNPKLNTLLPDPLHLLGMKDGLNRLLDAVEKGQNIAVFGDYDVDGATSSALIYRYFLAIGIKIRIYIPDRLKEGYGPNISAIDQLKSESTNLIITVDCGTAAHESLSYAKQQNIDVLVVDHHVAEADLPEAIAVVNPNRLDENTPHRQLAAVGVSFLLIIGLNKVLRECGYFQNNNISEPDMMQWLDLVALGTVADVVPLTGINRALVKQGLKVMAMRRNIGLLALADIAELDETPGAYHLGFIFGPRVNAGGRVGESHLGAKLLTTEDQNEAAKLAKILDKYNQDRKQIETEIYDQALKLVDTQRSRHTLIVIGEGWHPGVIGIIASRLKERFGLPTCVLTRNGDKITGSGRSVYGVDLGSVVIAARQRGILTAGGGHAMAAGFTMTSEKLEEFKEFIETRISNFVEENDIQPTLTIDSTLSVEAATIELVTYLERLGPFGSGNAEPRFAFASLRIAKSDVVGKDHVRCHLVDTIGQRLQAISFRSLNTDLGQRLLNHGGLPLNLVGRLRENSWQGRSSVQLLIDDGAEVN
ncbi:single-stranded-DNA-specific exonuclease RecJ [Rhodospirillales bacterium]|nr:single-stranded-DNA-specific exonuclease RecJ [Rhodospirillales bacterium]